MAKLKKVDNVEGRSAPCFRSGVEVDRKAEEVRVAKIKKADADIIEARANAFLTGKVSTEQLEFWQG